MKTTKLFMTAAVAIAASLSSACSDDGYWDGYSSPEATYSFITSSTSGEYTEAPETIDVIVTRSQGGGQVSVPVVVKSEDMGFGVPSEVTFAAGATKAELPVTLPSGMEVGNTYTVTIAFGEGVAVEDFNLASHTLKVSLAYTWTMVGEGSLRSELFGAEIPCPVARADQNPNLFRFYDVIEEGYNMDLLITGNGTNGILSPRAQNSGYDDDGNELYIYDLRAIEANVEGNTVTMPVYWCYKSGSSYSPQYQSTEVFVLPEGWNR